MVGKTPRNPPPCVGRSNFVPRSASDAGDQCATTRYQCRRLSCTVLLPVYESWVRSTRSLSINCNRPLTRRRRIRNRSSPRPLSWKLWRRKQPDGAVALGPNLHGAGAVPARPRRSASAARALMTSATTSSRGRPRSAAPRVISSRLTARANALSFNFFFTEVTSTS